MLSSLLGSGPHRPELLPRTDRDDVDAKMPASSATAAAAAAARSRDKIRCLDGLRGIACLIVFNYHFLWPWTPSIMLGYGALPPRAPEPYEAYSSLPILCLLNRGRPMVAIFFAISGYVLCRHILRAIHDRRIDLAYQKLASAVFRRVFRLYIPPTISMFCVAMLAQMGAFRSELDIYKGPDSRYINGTVTIAQLDVAGHCSNGTFPVSGVDAIAEYMGLRSSVYLNTTGWAPTICLNSSSERLSPAILYQIEEEYDALYANDTTVYNATTTKGKKNKKIEKKKKKKHTPHAYITDNRERTHQTLPYVFKEYIHGANRTNSTNTTDPAWIQFGGSWEEHPFIHDNITYALQNFTRAYAEWANPFNFGHYHTRYDPHTFTIPMELRGSMVIYLFLLGTAALKLHWRLRFGILFSAYSLVLGRWDMATFLGGTVMSEMDIWHSTDATQVLPPTSDSVKGRQPTLRPSTRGSRLKRWLITIVALYFLSYPDAGAEYTPGFVVLSYFVPKYYIPLSGWMFYQAMGAMMLLPCVLRSPTLRSLLEGRVAQYLGKISFSLYLVHGPILHSLGFWIMPRLFDRFGQPVGFAIGWVVLLSITLYLSNWWYKKVDVWSTTVGRRIESHLLDV